MGASVALHDDVLVVGAPHRDDDGSSSGAAYLYRYAGGRWRFVGRVNAPDAESGAYFGETVSVSGNDVLVGAPRTTVQGHDYAGVSYVSAVPAANLPPTAVTDVNPADGAEVPIGPDDTLVVSWTGSTDPEDDPIDYTWKLAADAGGLALPFLLSEPSGDLSFIVPYANLVEVLGDLGVADGEEVTLAHRVDAYDGQNAAPGSALALTLQRQGGVVVVRLRVLLQGALRQDGQMAALNGRLPLAQPYAGMPVGSPLHHDGTETLDPAVLAARTDVVDWVVVELRDAADGPAVAKRAAILLADGAVVDLDAESAPSFGGVEQGDYFVVVRHRNHLPVMSASPLAVSSGTDPFSFADDRGAGLLAWGCCPGRDRSGRGCPVRGSGRATATTTAGSWPLTTSRSGARSQARRATSWATSTSTAGSSRGDYQQGWRPNAGRAESQVPEAQAATEAAGSAPPATAGVPGPDGASADRPARRTIYIGRVPRPID